MKTAACLAFCVGLFLIHPASAAEILQSRRVTANGKAIPSVDSSNLRLPPTPRNILFEFGASSRPGERPARVRYKVDGLEENWRENPGELRMSIRFFDAAGDQISQIFFPVFGKSSGWAGSLENSAFTPRSETVVAPPRSAKFWVVMSSAGPPETIGLYAMTNMQVFPLQASGTRGEPLFKTEFNSAHLPLAWSSDGNRPSMSRILATGLNHSPALAILDDDAGTHAEWHTTKEMSPSCAPGQRLLLEWSEVYTAGLGGPWKATYPELPSGYFRFRVNELSIAGVPTDIEDSMALEVPAPFWKTPWFWVSVGILAVAGVLGAWKYREGLAMREEVRRLEQQRAIERERLRIAQDIHDDLGARVTQISLLSAMAGRKDSLDEVKADFDAISVMTRDLVSALYETVWAVDPANDNLDALGSYLCQMANDLSAQAQLRCRLEVPDLPTIPLASQTRHNLIMATKEAIHNVIKHARSPEVCMRIALEGSTLEISVRDQGCGFQSSEAHPGHGLKNIRSRLQTIGGEFTVQSSAGQGATVTFRLPLEENHRPLVGV